MLLKQFRTSKAKTHINQRKPGRPIKELLTNPRIQKLPRLRPTDDMRLDNEDHLPKKIKKGRCMLCPKGQTVYSCTKCNVRLCTLNEKNCFYTYHKQK